MKKHQIGGTIETLRESLGLEKKNYVNKAQAGLKFGGSNRSNRFASQANVLPEVVVKSNRPYRFDRRITDNGAGHQVASDILWDEYENGQYAGDYSGIAGGRTIYYSPQGNDTVYMNPSPIGHFMDQPGLKWIGDGSGYMPVPANRDNQARNKNAFYGNLRKSHVGANHEWMRPIFQRAKRGN